MSDLLGIVLALAVIVVPVALVYWLLRWRFGPDGRRRR
jgi:cation transporter-like permease